MDKLRHNADNLSNIEDDTEYQKANNQIKDELERENMKLIEDRHTGMANETTTAKDKENVIRNIHSIEKKTCYEKTIECLISVFSIFAPFKGAMTFLTIRYNSTIELLFNIIRLFIIFGFFNYLIFLYLWISHLINVDDLKEKCKYGFPCAFFYSSFTYEGADETYSLIYGIFLIFYVTFMICFYYYYQSKIAKEIPFFKTNRNNLLGSYLFTSWNFNTKNRIKSKIEKQLILDQCKNYIDSYSDKVRSGISDKSYFGNILILILSYLLFAVCLVITFVIIILCLYLRQGIRKKKELIPNEVSRNLFADVFSMMLIAFILILFPFLTELFAFIERWSDRRNETISCYIKRVIMVFFIVGSVLALQVKYTIARRNLDEKVTSVGIKGISSFSCPGNYQSELFKPYFMRENLTTILAVNGTTSAFYDTKGYSPCAENELSINFFFLFIFYFGFYLLKECLYLIIGYFAKMSTESYSPFNTLLHLFTEVILLSVAGLYSPFAFILVPFVFLIEFGLQYGKIRIFGTVSYDEVTVIKRNNANFINICFLLFNIANLFILLYFYVGKWEHESQITCLLIRNPDPVDPTGSRILNYINEFPLTKNQMALRYLAISKNAYDYSIMLRTEKFCGPYPTRTRIGNWFTFKFKDTFYSFYEVISSICVIIMLVVLIFSAMIFKNNAPNEYYYSYVIERHNNLLASFHLVYDQLLKRDIISGIMIRLNKANRLTSEEKNAIDKYK
ncbi:MAG: hypothetical protein MJ252_03435 [archaeon]|nr:hypothetical protein [archaeon]